MIEYTATLAGNIMQEVVRRFAFSNFEVQNAI